MHQQASHAHKKRCSESSPQLRLIHVFLNSTYHLSDATPSSLPWKQRPLVGPEERRDHLHALVPRPGVQDQSARGDVAAGSGWPIHQPTVPGMYKHTHTLKDQMKWQFESI